MGHMLSGSTHTTAVRRAIQERQESLIILPSRHAINSKTVMKWKRRTSVHDLLLGPQHAHKYGHVV
ncbi:hypothetical protein YTPLAS72_00530 [Nitrospira sp.]|nr:hypothetical protein YTPLAS72_00530 [Nitrospira sp.]